MIFSTYCSVTIVTKLTTVSDKFLTVYALRSVSGVSDPRGVNLTVEADRDVPPQRVPFLPYYIRRKGSDFRHSPAKMVAYRKYHNIFGFKMTKNIKNNIKLVYNAILCTDFET